MTETDLEACVRMLEGTEDFRVLRRIQSRPVVQRRLSTNEKMAIIVDTETTGLNIVNDEVIELAMIAVAYTLDGDIREVVGTFDSLREPSVPISPEATKLTGINPEMVQGHKIDDRALSDFLAPAALLVAHNAAFDRPMCEKVSPIFARKPWACSATEVRWQENGFEGTKLGYLVGQCGMFHSGHRALDDCFAVLEILARQLPNEQRSAFAGLLDSARKARFRICVRPAYELKDGLKSRGYRWNPGGNGRPRSWWIEVDEGRVDTELAFLSADVGVTRANVLVEKITAFERFRA